MFAAMASVALASCVKNEPVATVEQGDAILFNSPVVAPATKATTIADAVAFPRTDFDAYAWYSATAFDAEDDATAYFSKKTFTDAGSYWSATQAYWPKNGVLSFVAYAPAAAVTDIVSSAEKLTFNYEVAAEMANQKDLLYSEWVFNKTSANQAGNNAFSETGIDLPFHHALSAVKFMLQAADDDAAELIKIKSITLNAVKNAGTLTVLNTNDAAWSGVDGGANYAVLANADGEANATEIYTSAEAVSVGEFMLMPQTTSSSLSLHYYMMIESGDWIAQNTSINLDLAWVMGTRYTYTIVFDLDEIKLAPVVKEDWATSDADVPAVL